MGSKKLLMLTFVTSSKSVLFNTPFQTIYENIRELHPDSRFMFFHENSIDSNPINLQTPWPQVVIKDVFEKYEDLAFVKSFPIGDTYWNQNAIFWYRKIISLKRAKEDCKQGLLIWCDCDLKFLRKFTPEEVYEMQAVDVCHIARRRYLTETGFISFNMDALGAEMIDRMSAFYLTGEFQSHSRWDDCEAFDTCRKRSLDLKFKPFQTFTNLSELIFHAKGPFAEIRGKE